MSVKINVAMENKMSNCIWKVKPKDRRCGYCSYRPCADRDLSRPAPREYVDAMVRIIGGKWFLSSAKDNRCVWARNFIAYRMRCDGYSLSEISRTVNRTSATVLYCIRKVKEMLTMPEFYPYETEMWNNYTKIMKNEQDLDKDSEGVVL